jgi:hypothetical protein
MIGAKLPNASAANIDQSKITAYLLNLAHLKGGAKAKFFLARGFTPEKWEELADALRHHARHNLVAQITHTPFGVKYALDCNLPTPDQSGPCIRTVWVIVDPDSNPRLVTAYPLTIGKSAAS